MISCSLQIFFFLLFLFVESRHVTDHAKRPDPRLYSVLNQIENQIERPFELENGENTENGFMEEKRPDPRHLILPEIAEVIVGLKVEVRANPEIESEPEVKGEREAIHSLTKRDYTDYIKAKTFKVKMTTKNSQPYAPVKIGSKEYQVLIDTGSGMTLVSRKLFEQLLQDRQVKFYKEVRQACQTADGEKMTIKQATDIPFVISHFKVTFPFFVADELPMDLVLGYDFMVEKGAIIDFKHDLFTSNPPKPGCRSLLERVSSACCLLPAFMGGAPKTQEVQFVKGKPATVIPVGIAGVKYEALLDSGTAVSLISARFVKHLNEKKQIVKTEKASATIVIGGQESTLTERAVVPIKLGSFSSSLPFFIATTTPVDLIMGYDFMSANTVLLDYKTGALVFKEPSAQESAPKALMSASKATPNTPPK